MVSLQKQLHFEIRLQGQNKNMMNAADSEGKHVESTWVKTGHKIHDLQETLFDNNALPSLKGASSSAIGFISDVPAMGYQTYFVGPVHSDSPDQALRPNTSNAAQGDSSPSDGSTKLIQGHSMALILSEATGQPFALKAR